MIGVVFTGVVFVIAAWTLWAGTSEHRAAMGSLFCAFMATWAFYRWGTATWLAAQHAILGVDIVLLALLIFIALRSKRFWPLPVAALQVIPIMAHAGRTVGYGLDSYAVGVAQGAPSYLQVAIILIAVNRERKRQRTKTGNS